MPDVIDKRKTAKPGPFANPDGSLSQAGRDFLTAWLAKWVPVGLFKTKFRGLYHHACRTIGADETESACMLGITRALLTFDPALCQFQTYACYAMRNAVGNAIRPSTRHTERGIVVVSGHDRLPGHDRTEIFDTLGELDQCQSELDDNRTQIRKSIKKHLRCFPKRDRAIFYYHHGLLDDTAHTMAECAKVFGLTRSRVQQLVKRMSDRLLSELEELQREAAR